MNIGTECNVVVEDPRILGIPEDIHASHTTRDRTLGLWVPGGVTGEGMSMPYM